MKMSNYCPISKISHM